MAVVQVAQGCSANKRSVITHLKTSYFQQLFKFSFKLINQFFMKYSLSLHYKRKH